LEQLKKEPLHSYLAFNFFVTAEHMKDWLYPGHSNKGARQHFIAEAAHKCVADTRGTGGYWNAHYWAANWASGYWSEGGLFVELQGDAAKELEQVSVITHAESILEFWERRPELQGPQAG
jgi:hypothetical protein